MTIPGVDSLELTWRPRFKLLVLLDLRRESIGIRGHCSQYETLFVRSPRIESLLDFSLAVAAQRKDGEPNFQVRSLRARPPAGSFTSTSELMLAR